VVNVFHDKGRGCTRETVPGSAGGLFSAGYTAIFFAVKNGYKKNPGPNRKIRSGDPSAFPETGTDQGRMILAAKDLRGRPGTK